MYSIRPSHCNFVNVEPLNVFIFICLMGTRRYFRRSGRAFHHHSSAGNSPSRWQSPLVWVEWRLPRNDSSCRDVFHLEIHRIGFQFSLTDISWTCFATNLSQVFKTHESSNSTDTNRNLLQNPNEDEQKSWGSLEKDGRARILLMCDWQSRGCSSWCYYVKVPRRVVAANQTRRIYVEYGWPNLLYQSMLSY